MKLKFTPIKALALAAIIGATYHASACYYVVSSTCIPDGTKVDYLYFYIDGSTPDYPCYADGDWLSNSATYIDTMGDDTYASTESYACSGTMQFTNPLTSANQVVDNWQFGASGNLNLGSPGEYTYTGVNYSDPCSP